MNTSDGVAAVVIAYVALALMLVLFFLVPIPVSHRLRDLGDLDRLVSALYRRGFDGAEARVVVGWWGKSSSRFVVRKLIVRDDDVRLIVCSATGPLGHQLARSQQGPSREPAAFALVNGQTAKSSWLIEATQPETVVVALGSVIFGSSARPRRCFLTLHGVSASNYRIGWTA